MVDEKRQKETFNHFNYGTEFKHTYAIAFFDELITHKFTAEVTNALSNDKSRLTSDEGRKRKP